MDESFDFLTFARQYLLPILGLLIYWFLSRRNRQLPGQGPVEQEVVPPYAEDEPPPKPELPNKPERKSDMLEELLDEYSRAYDPEKARRKNDLAERLERAAPRKMDDSKRFGKLRDGDRSISIKSAPVSTNDENRPADRIRKRLQNPEAARDAIIIAEIFQRKHF